MTCLTRVTSWAAILVFSGVAAAGEQARDPAPLPPMSFSAPSLATPKLTLPELPASEPAPLPRKIERVYDLRVDLDGSLLVLGTVLWAGTSLLGPGSVPGPWCGATGQANCDPSGLDALDHLAVGLYSTRSALAANVMAGLVPGALTVMDIFDTGITHWRGWLADAVVITEAVMWTGAIQDITRRAVRRPRPFMYTPGLNPYNRDGPEANFSFFSGHTSNTFAMAVAVAYTYSLRHPGSKYRWLVWGLAMAGASTEPVLRVLAGDHFPTDVMIGALVGSAAGVLFPALHRRHFPLRLVTTSTLNATTLGLAGRW